MEIKSFIDPEICFLDNYTREEVLFVWIKKQFTFNKTHVPFYKKKYENIEATELKDYEDCLQKIPITTKEDLRKLNSAFDLAAPHIIQQKKIQHFAIKSNPECLK